MIRRRRFPQLYFGWWSNLITSILSGLAGGFFMQGFSVFFKSIAAELSLSRAAASVAAGVGALTNGVMFALTGWLSDRVGPKWVVFTGTCIMGIGLVLMYFTNSAWTFYFVWGVIIAAGQTLGFTVAHDTMLANWFISRRGLALGLRFAIISIVGVLTLPLISWLSVVQGWRETCLIWGGVTFAGIPLALYFVKQRRPEYYGLLPDGARVEPGSEAGTEAMLAQGVAYATGLQETEFTLKEAMKTPSYWIMTTAWIFNGIVFQSFNVHCIPFLTDRGIDPVAAGSMMAMMVFFTVPSRFLGGIIADRFRKEQLNYLLAVPFLLTSVGIATFLFNPTTATVYIFLILMGFGNGVIVPLDLVIRGRYFGRKAFGSIQGSSVIIAAPIAFFAPVLTGQVYDNTGKYTAAFTLFAAIAALAAFLLLLLHPPKPPVHTSDIHKLDHTLSS